MATNKKAKSTKKPKATEINTYDPVDDILHTLPNVIYDHVASQKVLTERFAKEDKALFRLADFQRKSLLQNESNLEYKPNPYNRRNEPLTIFANFLHEQIFSAN